MVQSPILGRMRRHLRRWQSRDAACQSRTSQQLGLRWNILRLSIRKLGRRERIVRTTHGLEQRFSIVRENLRLFLSARDRHVARPLIRRSKRFARHADQNLVDGDALAGMAGYAVSVCQMPEIAIDQPTMVDDDVAPLCESLDGK